MKKLFLFLLILLLIPQPALASVTNTDAQNFVETIGWSVNELTEYLDLYDLTIEDFDTLEELRQFVGTPLNETNRQEILARHNLTLSELTALLEQYGDTLDDYRTVEDLDNAIEFYLDFGEELDNVSNIFSLFGISDEEMDRLLLHLSTLDEQVLEAKMIEVENRLLAMDQFEITEELTQQEMQELAALWREMLQAFELQAKFFIQRDGQRTEITLEDLVADADLPLDTLVIEIYNLTSEFILDIQFSEELFDFPLLEEVADILVELPELANEHPFGEKMPKTASPYVLNMLVGFILASFAVLMFYRQRLKTKG